MSKNTIACLCETWRTTDVEVRVNKGKYSEEIISSLAEKKEIKGRAICGLVMRLNKNYYKTELLFNSKYYIICRIVF